MRRRRHELRPERLVLEAELRDSPICTVQSAELSALPEQQVRPEELVPDALEGEDRDGGDAPARRAAASRARTS